MLASEVIDRARLVLQDPVTGLPVDGVRWKDAEMFQWITDGQRVIVLVRPDACVENAQIKLAAGTKQTIPEGGLRLLDVVRNIPTITSTNGRAIRLVDREVLDTADPNWHTQKPAVVIRSYVFDNRDPTVFYVSPPAIRPDPKMGESVVEVIYSKMPADVTAPASLLSIPDIYIDPLLNYVLFRAYSKDAQFIQNAQLAAAYLQSFMTVLGIKGRRDISFAPDLHSKGALPNAAAIQMEGA